MLGSIRHIHWLGQLLILAGVYIITEALFVFLANGIINAMYPGMDTTKLILSLSTIKSADEINDVEASALKWYQAITSLGRFVLVSLFFAELLGEKPGDFLRLKKTPTINGFILIPFIIIAASFSIAVIDDWNAGLHLPSAWSSIEDTMRLWEQQAIIQTDIFLRTETISGLLVNILVICVIAGIGEELLFRGVLQGLIEKGTGKPHLAIWVSATLFSAIHLQFFGFFPRLLLGALNGYLFYYSRSLWAPIWAHFINNLLTVMAIFLTHRGVIQGDITESSNIWFGLIAAPFVFLLLYLYRNKESHGKRLDAGVLDVRQDGGELSDE
ncbi:MAG TPA: CPBP family intramembrane metalloprotease [Chitinophagales bacterium]|nr:CPBP family intramembrane metalloprotease [Chitinophagales bacterium]